MKVHLSTTIHSTVLVYVEADVSEGAGRKGQLYLLEETEPKMRAWKATSGPYGKGAAPRGEYQISRPKEIDNSNAAFRDPSGFAWFAALTPTGQPNAEGKLIPHTDRTGLGIHPDGNVPGTQGCIGIVEKDTRSLFDLLNTAQEPMVLYVV